MGDTYSILVNEGRAIVLKAVDSEGKELIEIHEDGKPIFIQGPDQDSPSQPKFNLWKAIIKAGSIGLSLVINQGVAHAGEIAMNAVAAITELVDITLLNGVRISEWDIKEGSPPPYFESGNPFRKRLNDLGVSDGSIRPIALFEKFGTDLLHWLVTTGMTEKIQREFSAIKKNQPDKSFVPLAYSGAGLPTILALTDGLNPYLQQHSIPLFMPQIPGRPVQDFGVETVVLVGTPFYEPDTKLKSGSLKRIINVYGSDDPFYKSNILPPPPQRFTHLQHSMETINIELKDIHHTEYFYKNGDSPTDEQKKASNFLARLTQASIDPLSPRGLANLLNRIEKFAISFRDEPYEDPVTKIVHRVRTYVINTKSIPDDL